MADRLDVAVIGAGPFGLSVAAHLNDRPVRVFGAPMQTWRTRMPPDMRLRSDWEETSLSAPGDRGSIDVWSRAQDEPREEPIPLTRFLKYADWFRSTFVPENDPSDVAQLERAAGVFRVTTTEGEEADARLVVVAVGVTPFPHAPPPFDAAMGDGIGFAIERQDYEAYRGGRVIVVGGGQGGLEAAALARRAGAEVELVIRSQLRWFTDREPYRPRGPLQQRIYRLAYPVVGYGPPPLNRLALNPDTFAALPPAARRSVHAVVRSSGRKAVGALTPCSASGQRLSAGLNSSIRFPEGSASRIWRPPGPETTSLRKETSAARSLAISASRSSTTS